MQWELEAYFYMSSEDEGEDWHGPSDNKKLIWESLTPEIATIENGIIQPIAEGDVEVTVYYPDFKVSDRATFHVGHYVELLEPYCYDYLINAGYDTDNDGRFSLEEMADIKEIRDTIEAFRQGDEQGFRWIPFLGMMKNLEAFMSIDYPDILDFIWYPRIDFSRNTKLKYLTLCGWKNVKIANPNLVSLYLYDYENLDIDLGVSPHLEQLYIDPEVQDYSVQYNLDCSKNENLKYVVSHLDNIIIPKSVIDQTNEHYKDDTTVEYYRLPRDEEESYIYRTTDQWKETCTWYRFIPQRSYWVVSPTTYYIFEKIYIENTNKITIQ